MKENLNEEIKRNRELMGLMTEGESSENSSLFNKQKEDLNIIDLSSLSKYPRQNEKLKKIDYFITHHTAGPGSCENVISVLNNHVEDGVKTPLGIHYVVDRNGNACKALPDGSRGAHILKSPMGATNDNSIGVEVVAENDDDILPIQALTVLKLVKQIGISPEQILGHGEVNKGARPANEGKRIKQFIKLNYNKSPITPYDYSMFDKQKAMNQKFKDLKSGEVVGLYKIK